MHARRPSARLCAMSAHPHPCRAASLTLLAAMTSLGGSPSPIGRNGAAAPRSELEGGLRYAAEGALRRSFGEDTRFELESLVERASGEELPADEVEFTGSLERRVELVDTLGALEDGRPEQLTRRFEETSKRFEVELALQGFEELYDAELESALAGETVRLAWDDDEQAFVASSETGLEAHQLERLREDCDLRALLPEQGGEAEEGAEWTVPAERLRDLLAPAGRLLFTGDELPDGPYGALTPTDLVATTLITLADTARELDGEARLRWSGTVDDQGDDQGDDRGDEQGDRLAVIELELELTLAGAVDDDLEQLVGDMGAGGKRDVALDYSWHLEGRGQLVWALEAGHFRELELALEGQLELEMVWSGANGEEGMLVGLATTSELTATCERE